MEDRTCPAGDFRCHSGQCIAGNLKCNEQKDCEDGSDETGCPIAPTRCDVQTQFDCSGDGTNCIDVSLVCNQQNDCGAGEDEKTDVCHRSGGYNEFFISGMLTQYPFTLALLINSKIATEMVYVIFLLFLYFQKSTHAQTTMVVACRSVEKTWTATSVPATRDMN